MGSNPAGTTKILIVGREDDGSGLLIHRSENSNIGSNPILSAKGSEASMVQRRSVKPRRVGSLPTWPAKKIRQVPAHPDKMENCSWYVENVGSSPTLPTKAS